MQTSTIGLDKPRLREALHKVELTSPVINIVGDLILDEYMIGFPERISREAPVLILEYQDNYFRLGGAANAAMNAGALGARVNLFGVIGADQPGERLRTICKENRIELFSLDSPERHTTLKTRIAAANQGSRLSKAGTLATQQVLRIDRISRSPFNPIEKKALLNLLRSKVKHQEMILLSDYKLGVVDLEVIELALNLSNQVIADPAGDFARFSGCSLITPNQPDTEENLNFSLADLDGSEEILKALRQKLKERLPGQTEFLITRGAEGMLLLTSQKAIFVPAFNLAEVFDVTGAGDTVSACISICRACGVPILEAVTLGNLAASIVVRKSGAATTSLTELREHLEFLPQIEFKCLDLI